MHSCHSRGASRRTSSRRRLVVLLGLTLAASTACNSLLTVENPGRVEESSLDDPALMPILEAAAIQQLQCGINNFAATAGMLSGEFLSSNGFVNNHPWEWRGAVEIRNEPGSCNTGRASTFMGFYTPLQQARYQLDDTFTRLEKFTDAQVANRARFLTEMRAYGGYAYLLLGEGMCEMTIDNGPKMTKQEVWAIAEKRFTDAIALAATIPDAAAGASLRNMALVGRARTRLDLGNLTGAAADAALVPQGYVRTANFSETNTARENRFYNLTFRNDYLSVGENYRGLTVGTQADPRVKVTNLNRVGNDNVTPMWRQEKYTGSGAAPQTIASWNEAQLILAEAVGGQAGIDALNRVRTANGVTTPLVYAGGDIIDIVLEERRRQLFAEGQRYVDMLRKNLPFPTGINGANRKGQVYGPVTCVPLPNVETQNNPNFKT
jgi:starch-binding outer membrane protein, SusD/RagB family